MFVMHVSMYINTIVLSNTYNFKMQSYYEIMINFIVRVKIFEGKTFVVRMKMKFMGKLL